MIRRGGDGANEGGKSTDNPGCGTFLYRLLFILITLYLVCA